MPSPRFSLPRADLIDVTEITVRDLSLTTNQKDKLREAANTVKAVAVGADTVDGCPCIGRVALPKPGGDYTYPAYWDMNMTARLNEHGYVMPPNHEVVVEITDG